MSPYLLLSRADNYLSLLLYVGCFCCLSGPGCPQVHTPTHPSQRQYHDCPSVAQVEKCLEFSYLQSIQLSKSPTYTGENFIWKSCSLPAGMEPLQGSTENSGLALTAFRDELREEETCSRVWLSWLEQRLAWSFTEAPEVEERKSPAVRKK